MAPLNWQNGRPAPRRSVRGPGGRARSRHRKTLDLSEEPTGRGRSRWISASGPFVSWQQAFKGGDLRRPMQSQAAVQPMLLGGEWKTTSASDPVHDPATGQVIA